MKVNQYRKLIITNESGNNSRDHISTWLNTQAVFLNISMERIGLLEQVIHLTKPSRHPVHRSTHVTFISTISDKLIVSCPLKSTKECSMYHFYSSTLTFMNIAGNSQEICETFILSKFFVDKNVRGTEINKDCVEQTYLRTKVDSFPLNTIVSIVSHCCCSWVGDSSGVKRFSSST